MANPAVITCTKDTWVVVATAVKSGTIKRLKQHTSKYLQTYRVTGDPAPTDNADGAEVFTKSNEAIISHVADIDVYIKSLRYAGEVRVDL